MDNRANLSVSWKAVAIAATIATLAALTLTGIVATVKQADTLAVIALGVAVVAFVIQIIVFIVQAAAATEQSLRAQEVYGSTLKVLATIEEKAEGTRQTVSTINDKMLSVLIGKAIPEAINSDIPVTSPNFSAEVAERVVDLASRSDLGDDSSVSVSRGGLARGTSRTETKKEVVFPDAADVERVIPKISDLTPLGGLFDLETLGRDWINYDTDTNFSGLPLVANSDTLYDRGLIRHVRRKWWKDDPVFVLSPDGEIAARIILAKNVPANAPAEIKAIREALRKARAQRAYAARRRNSNIPVEE